MTVVVYRYDTVLVKLTAGTFVNKASRDLLNEQGNSLKPTYHTPLTIPAWHSIKSGLVSYGIRLVPGHRYNTSIPSDGVASIANYVHQILRVASHSTL